MSGRLHGVQCVLEQLNPKPKGAVGGVEESDLCAESAAAWHRNWEHVTYLLVHKERSGRCRQMLWVECSSSVIHYLLLEVYASTIVIWCQGTVRLRCERQHYSLSAGVSCCWGPLEYVKLLQAITLVPQG